MMGLLSGIQSKLIIVLGILVPIMGYALYHQIQANGTLYAEREQLYSDLEQAGGEIERLQNMQQLAEAIVLKTSGKIRTITQTETRTRWKIREIVKEIETEDPNTCLVQPVPDRIAGLLRETGDHRSRDPEDLPPDDPDTVD